MGIKWTAGFEVQIFEIFTRPEDSSVGEGGKVLDGGTKIHQNSPSL